MGTEEKEVQPFAGKGKVKTYEGNQTGTAVKLKLEDGVCYEDGDEYSFKGEGVWEVGDIFTGNFDDGPPREVSNMRDAKCP